VRPAFLEVLETAPGDPDCSQPGRNRQRNLSKCLAQKYPNSFSHNTKDCFGFGQLFVSIEFDQSYRWGNKDE
jgi:hypothetical protein